MTSNITNLLHTHSFYNMPLATIMNKKKKTIFITLLSNITSKGILVARNQDGSFMSNNTKSCMPCQNNTLPNARRDRCVFCEQSVAAMDAMGDCECTGGWLKGELCLKQEPRGTRREQLGTLHGDLHVYNSFIVFRCVLTSL